MSLVILQNKWSLQLKITETIISVANRDMRGTEKRIFKARGIQDLDQIRGSLKDQRPSTRNLIIRIHSLNTTWWSKPLSSGQNRSNDSQFFGVLIPNRI